MPGGGPQGTVLGMFLFIVLINLVGFKSQVKDVGKVITKPLNKRKPMDTIHLKFIDDLTVAESLNLKKQVIENPDKNQTSSSAFTTELNISSLRVKVDCKCCLMTLLTILWSTK